MKMAVSWTAFNAELFKSGVFVGAVSIKADITAIGHDRGGRFMGLVDADPITENAACLIRETKVICLAL